MWAAMRAPMVPAPRTATRWIDLVMGLGRSTQGYRELPRLTKRRENSVPIWDVAGVLSIHSTRKSRPLMWDTLDRNTIVSVMPKKSKSGGRGSTPKRSAAPKTVDEYLARVPEPARSTLDKVRAAIRSAAPSDATETISYGMPAFNYKGVLVWFAAFSNHCSLFPTAAIIEAFNDELKDFVTSKGTIQFPIDK